MGRKIPAKKHRGVKDPVLQQIKRLESLKGKINAPPKDPDDQPVPRSLTRLFAFQEQKRRRLPIIKKNTGHLVLNKDDSVNSLSKNPVSKLRKLPGESGREFSLRINNAVRSLNNAAEDLNYPLDVETQDVKGMRMSELRERRARKRRRRGADSGATAATTGAGTTQRGGDEPPTLTRTHKLALRRKARKMKAEEANKERHEVVYERVSFGEVSHAPPALQLTSPRGNSGAPRPGRRDLLLNALLAGGDSAGNSNNSNNSNNNNNNNGNSNKTGAAAAAAERRLQAVAAYRALKAYKLTNKKTK